MPLRSAKMNLRILGFHRRVWCPKWTPASRSARSWAGTAMGGTDLLRSVRPPPDSADAAIRRCAADTHGILVRCVNFAGRQSAGCTLPLRELEALACLRLPVLLPLDHPRIARQQPFRLERLTQALVGGHQRAGQAELD